VTNWTVAIAIPSKDFTDELRHRLWWLVAVATVLLSASLGLAWTIAGRIAGSIHALAAPALALGSGEAVTVAPLRLKEADEVGRALTNASATLRAAQHKASHDVLTGLANRALFNEILNRQLAICHRAHSGLSIFYVDIDGFKPVNDAHGHAVGDEVLRMVAARLKDALRESDVVARLGGDEFAGILIDTRLDDARAVATKVIEALSAPFSINSARIEISASVGIAGYPESATTGEALLVRADEAMYDAKVAGKRRYGVAGDTRRGSLEDSLRLALQRDELELHYQPKVDIDTRRIVGLEALIRWRSAELGLVSPLQFVPVLEETGMILEVGRWVFRQAMRDRAHWEAQGVTVPRIAVNVSAIQLRERSFVESVCEALNGRYVIDLEITESRIMEDIDANIEKLRQLRSLGVGIAIDDFGTGYSSLAYLAKLPVQSVKIDRTFVSRMLKDDENMAVVQTIISLARSLNLTTVAEGVETEEQADMLGLLRCDQLQGYLMSEPVPPAEAMRLLKASASRHPL
jgi:diguanylate cyclase (GGDEF)-like protein